MEGGISDGGPPADVPKNSSGHLLTVSSPEAVEDAHNAEMDAKIQLQPETIISPLISYVQAIIQENQEHRRQTGVEDALVSSAERCQSRYSDTKMSKINEYGGSAIYMGLTGVKVRNAIAWISEILTTDREQLWRLEPTPIVDIPKPLAEQIAEQTVLRIRQVQQEAIEAGQKLELTPQIIYELASGVRDQVLDERRQDSVDAAARMERVIQDQMVESDFNDVFEQLIEDVCSSKAAILKGPIAVSKKVRAWQTQDDGTAKMGVEVKVVPSFYRVDPINFYPSPVAGKPNQGNVVERVGFEHGQLAGLRGQTNYSTEAINRVLGNFNNTLGSTLTGGEHLKHEQLRSLDSTKEGQIKTSLVGWEVWAAVPGKDLIDFGFKKGPDGETPIDANDVYDVNIILVDDELIYLDYNMDDLGTRPYSAAGWGRITGSFWSQSIAELMADIQDMCNGSARALSNNMAFSSGPQTVINDIGRIPDGETLTPPQPFKMWQFVNQSNNSGKPVDFFQPDSNAAELLSVYDRFAKLADDYTGIPAYAYGNDRVAGAGRTASGLSMLMSSAARGVKKIILRMDDNILRKAVEDLYYYNLKYSEDAFLRKAADVNIVATGAIQIMVKEQMASRRLEFLQATTNDIDFKLMSHEGRADMLRDIASTLDMDSSPVKTREQIAEMIQQDAQAAAEQRQVELAELQRKAQMEEAELALKAAEIALKQAEAEEKNALEREKLGAETPTEAE